LAKQDRKKWRTFGIWSSQRFRKSFLPALPKMAKETFGPLTEGSGSRPPVRSSGRQFEGRLQRSHGIAKHVIRVEVNKLNCSTKEITKYPCCNQLISGKPGGAFLECCNKIEGINSPLPEHCMGLDIEKFIVQLQLCIWFLQWLTFFYLRFPFSVRWSHTWSQHRVLSHLSLAANGAYGSDHSIR